jgi:hypothetical protein
MKVSSAAEGHSAWTARGYASKLIIRPKSTSQVADETARGMIRDEVLHSGEWGFTFS